MSATISRIEQNFLVMPTAIAGATEFLGFFHHRFVALGLRVNRMRTQIDTEHSYLAHAILLEM
jgi:hypothetical protein